MDDAVLMRTLYEGDPIDRLMTSRALLARGRSWWLAEAGLTEAIEQLQRDALALDAHMAAMGLGRLCGQCAARPDGGCCSAYMAGNTDAIQMLINLLLGIEATPSDKNDEDCCFLGERGCLFVIKPIFCLNYLCSHITDAATTENLHTLHCLSAAVLSGQTGIESKVLDLLRRQGIGMA